MRAFTLYSGSLPKMLNPVPVPEAFARLEQLLLTWQSPDQLPSPLESRLLKEQFLAQVAGLETVGDQGHILHLSRQSMAAGLLCGALDGGRLYLADELPEPFESPPSLDETRQGLAQIVEVADQYWRGLDLENLELQSRYGKEQNLRSDEENLARLNRRGASGREARQQFSETFRTGYGVGLIEAALILLFR